MDGGGIALMPTPHTSHAAHHLRPWVLLLLPLLFLTLFYFYPLTAIFRVSFVENDASAV